MPNIHNFDILPDFFSWTTHKCVEKDCGFGGPKWEMTDKVMSDHALTHFREPETVVNLDGLEYEVRGLERIQPCRVCGNDFSQPRRRGRPRLECDDCKGK